MVASPGIESKERLGRPNSSVRWPSTRTCTDSATCEALRASSSRWPRNSCEACTAFGETGGAFGAQASDSVVDAFDRKHDAPEAQRVRRCDRRFDLDQFWIAKLRQLKPPGPIWGPHHNDVDLDTFEPVDAVHPRALDRRLAFDRHAERGEKSDSACKVVDHDADVVQSLDRHVPSIVEAVRGGPGRPFSRLGRG